jgi:flap endonuclease-1
MDALTFRTPKLLRKLTFSSGQAKQPIIEIDFEAAISGLGLTYEQFVDLCIMCGCDYCSTIKGIGPKTALRLIKQHGSLENVIKALKKEGKYQIPDDWNIQRVPRNQSAEVNDSLVASEDGGDLGVGSDGAEDEEEDADDRINPANTSSDGLTEAKEGEDGDEAHTGPSETAEDDLVKEEMVSDENYEIVDPLYVQARRLFIEPEVVPGESIELRWEAPDEVRLKQFLVERMGFNSERVDGGIKRLLESQQKRSQQRMDRLLLCTEY